MLVDELRGSEAQHGIAEEFQPFKVFASAGRYVDECFIHQAQQLGGVELLQANRLQQLQQVVCSCAVQRSTGLGVKAGHKPGSVHATTEVGLRRVGGYLSGTAVADGLERRIKRNGADGQPSFLGLAPSRGLPSQHLSMLLVRSYRTFAPLPVPANRPSAVCFCGTLLTVTRTGRYPASLAIGEPGLSSIESRTIQLQPPRLLSALIMPRWHN